MSMRDWEEDSRLENGKYQRQCYICKAQFIGHKRRVACRLCAKPVPPNPVGEVMQEVLRKAIEARTEHLEMYAAAFVKEVGCEEASKYVLTERLDHATHTYTWAFKLRSEVV